MKKSRASYYLLGNLNTDATLAGTIAPTDYRDDTILGIIKEGSGTYRITGNNNYISGALRILDGRLLVCNDRAEAETKKMRGATGAKASANEATVYVFEKGLLGGTGSIGGTVDNYGTIEPGDDAIGTLTIQNYQTPAKQPNLTVHPASVLRFKLGTDGVSDQLAVGGTVSYSNMLQDFNEGDAMPVIEIVPDGSPLELGATFLLLTAKSKTGDWNFDLKQPGQYTWEIDEQIADDGTYNVVLRLVSFDDPDNPDNPDDPDTPVSTMGPFYDDGIDDATDNTTLRAYAEKSGKKIGTAISTWKNDVGNENLSETKEIAAQFSMLAPENEMKMDALQPSQGQFTYGSADKLVSFAQRHDITMRGHCLVWHQQQPEWVSSDGKKNDKGWSRTEALAIMNDHITKVMKHFKGKVVEWDVVNECLDDDQSIIRSQPDGYTLRPTVWQRAIGDDYIDSAFVYARRADPDAVLYLNDYDVEHQGKAKATAFYNLAMRLKKKNIPVDGVGLQCHFSVGSIDSLKLERTIQRFAEADMLCIITELDVGIASTSTANLEEQARNYRVITDIVLNNQNCPHLVIWGLKDNDSWRSGSSPLLYTSGLAKKPAYYAVRSALRHRELHPSDVTAISTIEQHSDDAIFDLGGRRIAAGSSLRPGIYIQNGRKIIFR